MAHCSSSLVHTPSFTAHKSAHNENSQDVLPPRKRLLVGLKHTAATHPSTPPMPPPAAESLRIEMHVDATQAAPAPPFSLLLHSPTQKCFSCGDGGVILHRVPCLAGSSSYHCSSCVLAINKTMYCVLCYQVIEQGSSSSSTSSLSSGLLTCCRCQRLTHLDCALKLWSPSLEGVCLTLCRDCYTRNNGQGREAPIKNQKIGNTWRFKEAVVSAGKVKLPLVDMQELAAARIVAIMAKRAALDAKQKAEILAKAAACAAMHAKAALDNVYNLSQKETDINGDSDVHLTAALKDVGPIAAPKTPKGLKRRALSAIVASEMQLKRDGTTVNQMVMTEYPESKHTQIGIDASLSHDFVVEDPSQFATQRARLAVKRRKTLSSLGLQNPTKTCKMAVLQSSKLASRKTKKPNLLSRGKLGEIVSQVLASNRLSKSTTKVHSYKARDLGPHYDDALENVGKKKIHRVDAMTLESDRLLDESSIMF